eukprot:gene6163-9205_t
MSHIDSRNDDSVIAALDCIRHMCVSNRSNQNRMAGLGAGTILPLICNLPIRFITSMDEKSDSMFAAICAVCLDNCACMRLLRQNMSPLLVIEYLQFSETYTSSRLNTRWRHDYLQYFTQEFSQAV